MERSGTNALGVRRPASAAALSFRASARREASALGVHTGVGIRLLVGADAHVRPPLFDKKPPAVDTRLKDAAINGRRLVTAPKGGDIMYWILTFHIGRYSVSIRVMKLKDKNRHSDK